jgi:hypothetical protein
VISLAEDLLFMTFEFIKSPQGFLSARTGTHPIIHSCQECHPPNLRPPTSDLCLSLRSLRLEWNGCEEK